MVHVNLLKAFDKHNDILYFDACIDAEGYLDCKAISDPPSDFLFIALKRWS